MTKCQLCLLEHRSFRLLSKQPLTRKDRDLTNRLVSAANILGIRVLDHIIFGRPITTVSPTLASSKIPGLRNRHVPRCCTVCVLCGRRAAAGILPLHCGPFVPNTAQFICIIWRQRIMGVHTFHTLHFGAETVFATTQKNDAN